MTTKKLSIDQLVKLTMRLAQARIRQPQTHKHEAMQQAILAACQHLSHEASYRSDITELVRLSTLAAASQPIETSALASNNTSLTS